MASSKRKSRPEEEPNGPGDWIVTFSDCMTLLLCFFVLLLTFSSFDEVELQKLAGAFDTVSHDSIFPNPRRVRDSVVPPVQREVRLTKEGSETATDSPPARVEFPAQPRVILDDDAHKDRKVFYIPSEWLFWGNGSVLTPEGRAYLKTIGSFMKMVPSRVVIAETGPGAADPAQQACLDRAWSVMRFLTDGAKLPSGLFSISASKTAVPSRLKARRVLAVTLIPKEVY